MPPRTMSPTRLQAGRLRYVLLWSLGLLYLAAGLLHLAWPAPFLSITPHWVPWAREIIAVTGLCEILGAVGLFLKPLRRFAGLALALYAVCVFPANVTHALNDLGAGTGLGLWYHVPRLLLQPVIIWATLYATSVTDWPVATVMLKRDDLHR